jgi:ABC-type phosphate transport system substrate-binding protein
MMNDHFGKPFFAVFIAATLIAGLGVLGVPKLAFAQQVTINGAGATFPFPLIDTWRVEYQKVKPEVSINYQSIGSGGGIKQFTEKTVGLWCYRCTLDNRRGSRGSWRSSYP